MADEYDDEDLLSIAPAWAPIWNNPIARGFGFNSLMLKIIRGIDPEEVMS